jgi:hypothetical protein
MPRILVTAERGRQRPEAPVLLDEKVLPDHLHDDHAAAQLIERIGWAVSDAEDVERRKPPGKRRTHSARRLAASAS